MMAEVEKPQNGKKLEKKGEWYTSQPPLYRDVKGLSPLILFWKGINKHTKV